MKELENLLITDQFIRVHHSFIISVEQISLIDKGTIQLRRGGLKAGISLGSTNRKPAKNCLECRKFEIVTK